MIALHASSFTLGNGYLVAGIIVGVIAIMGALFTLFRIIHRFTGKIADFLDDWRGTVARPGVIRRSGVMERLDDQDKQLTDIQDRMVLVEGELKNNSGTSVKDVVHRIEDRVAKIEQRLGEK